MYDCDLFIFTLKQITTPVRWYVAFPITVTIHKGSFYSHLVLGECSFWTLPPGITDYKKTWPQVLAQSSAAAVHWSHTTSHTCPDALPYVAFMGEVCNILSVFQDWTDVICWPLHLLYSNALLIKMGGSGSKTKGVWPFSSSGAGGEAPGEINEQCLARLRGSKNATPFVFTRRR